MGNLFLIVAMGIGAVMLGQAVLQTTALHKTLAKATAKTRFPQAISMVLLAAQANELVRAVEHASVVNIAAVLILLAILLATKSGTEGEMH